MGMQSFNKIEQEAIVLKAICGLIDEMVNYGMFDKQWTTDCSNIAFRTREHSQLFNILLVDFLSLPNKTKGGKLPFDFKSPSNTALQSDRSYLFLLKEIVKEPQFSTSVEGLQSVVFDFANWLDGDTVIENVGFSNLNVSIDIKVNRGKALKMTGDIGKHNFTRLTRVVATLQETLAQNGCEKSIDECYLALPEFQDWFYDHAFVYQSSQITEYLNNLRWAIHQYLLPEFNRSYEPYFDKYLIMKRYKFDVPKNIKNIFAKEMYWELMNRVRSDPIVQKFSVSESMKSELS